MGYSASSVFLVVHDSQGIRDRDYPEKEFVLPKPPAKITSLFRDELTLEQLEERSLGR